MSGRTKASTATPLQRRLRGALVVAEIALAVVLLIGAALMVRSFLKLNAIDIGFNPDKLLAVSIGLDTVRYPTEASRLALLRRVAQDTKDLPGVTGVALSSGLPPSPGSFGMGNFHLRGRPLRQLRARAHHPQLRDPRVLRSDGHPGLARTAAARGRCP